MVYHEHFMRLTGATPVTGHPDLFIQHRENLRVVEMKTIDGDKFAVLPAPLAEHELQLQTYMWGLQSDKRMPVKIDPDFGYLLYLSKKHASGKLPLKMFPIRRNPELIEGIQSRLSGYRAGLDDPDSCLPEPLTICQRSSFENYRARTCPCLEECRNANSGD
jgi:hypothetical protein